ncbi:hypothetical protein [Paracidovorax anthurii]|uniref:Uncharacterized protein n=1 Tax=Paracidovorax anthurii TaxID=78229 RepID=A0A328YS02_9BURK|nr:hypothetical protein [Paracidovorax anthurii]RAR76194.1 hypothetical protein AX018_10523 [Paracidovorax anthurii]
MALKQCVATALCAAALVPVTRAQDLNLDEPARKPYRIGTVASVQITRAAAESAAGETASCAGTRHLTQRDVRRFLAHARPISRRGYLQDHFLTGDCYTEAKVTFKDGRTIRLGIANDAGTALLTPIVRGQEQEPGHYLRCAQCAGLLDRPDRLPTQ